MGLIGAEMQDLRAIKKRITTINNTLKITNAMRLIAASKLRKLQDRSKTMRIYMDTMKDLALLVSTKSGDINAESFALRKQNKKNLIIVITPMRGFCGGLSEEIINQLIKIRDIMEAKSVKVAFAVSGSEGVKNFKRFSIDVKNLNLQEGDILKKDYAKDIKKIHNLFLNNEYDRIMLAYHRFLSPMQHPVTLDMFLPIWVKDHKLNKKENATDFIFEPSKTKLIKTLITSTLDTHIKQALLESSVSEAAARMISMFEATNNGKKITNKLKQEYNRLRQANITKEVLNIMGSASNLGR